MINPDQELPTISDMVRLAQDEFLAKRLTYMKKLLDSLRESTGLSDQEIAANYVWLYTGSKQVIVDPATGNWSGNTKIDVTQGIRLVHKDEIGQSGIEK